MNTIKSRQSNGSSFVFALYLCIAAMSIGLFALSYLRTVGSRAEQNSAIQAAALAAAGDLGRLVIDDPHFGFVGLFDQAPEGKSRAAKDGYGLRVHSFNSILATIRSNLVLADLLHNSHMRSFALTDYAYAMKTRIKLIETMNDSISPSSQLYQDTDGRKFSPYLDALEAYQKNQIRMSGRSSLVVNSLHFVLRQAVSSMTLTPVPLPRTSDPALPTNDCESGYYLSNKNISYDGCNFVFASVGVQTCIVGAETLKETGSCPETAVPTLVQASAVQHYQDGAKEYSINATAYAKPGGMQDTFFNPGALVLTLPDGLPVEFSTPLSLVQIAASKTIPARWRSIENGDYPQSGSFKTLTKLSYPVGATMDQSIELAYYLWFKNFGPFANLQSCLNVMNSPFITNDIDRNRPLFVVYKANSDGTIGHVVDDCVSIYAPNSDQQLSCASCSEYATASTARAYDMIVSYNTYQPGRTNGGRHGGEPIVDARLDPKVNPLYGTARSTSRTLYAIEYLMNGWKSSSGSWAFNAWSSNPTQWPGGGDMTPANIAYPPDSVTIGALRPTALSAGLTVEISLHQLSLMPQLSPNLWGPWEPVSCPIYTMP